MRTQQTQADLSPASRALIDMDGAGPGTDRIINNDFKDITPDTDGFEKPAPTRKLPED